MRRIAWRKRIFLMLLSALLLCLWGCQPADVDSRNQENMVTVYENGNEAPRKGGTLRLALTGAKSLNPLLADNQHNLYVLRLIFDGLFRSNPDKTVEPVLCESYGVSVDGLTYSFNIRDGVSFHNGQKLTAKDAEASLNLLLGSESIYADKLACVESCSSQGMTLKVTLQYPVINFTALMDFPIVSAADMGTRADLYVPNGTGRYKVQSYKQSKELYLSVNENYYKMFEPNIENILIYQLKDSQTAIAMMENLQLNLLTSSAVNLYEYTPKLPLYMAGVSGNRFNFLGINNQNSALLSPTTRMALSLSIDRVTLLEAGAVTCATPAELPFPPASVLSGAHGEGLPYDPEQARGLLAEDGWADSDGDGVLEKDVYGEPAILSLSVLVNEENPTRAKLAELLKEYLREIGVPLTVVSVPFEEYQTRISEGNYDLFIGSVSLGDNFDVSCLVQTDVNPLGVSDEWMDQLLISLALQKGESAKLAVYSELCENIRSKAILSGLYFENEYLLFDETLKGDIAPSATDLFYGIENWFFIKEK